MTFFHGIMPKILLPVIFFSVVLVGITLVVSTMTFQNYVEHSIDKEIEVIGRDLNHELALMQNMALMQVEHLADMKGIAQAIFENNREELSRVFEEYRSAKKCDFFTIVDPSGNVIFRSSAPEIFGDSQLHLQSIKNVLSKRTAEVGFESTAKVRLAIRAATPVFNEKNTASG